MAQAKRDLGGIKRNVGFIDCFLGPDHIGLPLLFVVICLGVRVLITNSAQKTEEECQQMVADSVEQYLRAFDEMYDNQGISYEIEYIEMEIGQPTFSWTADIFVEPGWIRGEIRLPIDTPVA